MGLRPVKTNLEIDVGDMTFADGVLPRLIAALRECRDGESFSVVSKDPSRSRVVVPVHAQ
jgi:hypothetical protein